MPQKPSLSCLCFSKDRPLQLEGYIRSLRICVYGDVALTVLYVASGPPFESAYETLRTRFPDVVFVRESNFRRDFSHWLRNVKTPLLLFGCDDVVFNDLFDLRIVERAFSEEEGLFGFSLRLGKLLSHCAMRMSPEVPPPFLKEEPYLLWRRDAAEFDWAYAFELDCTIYPKSLVEAMIAALNGLDPISGGEAKFQWGHPNKLERAGNAILSKLPSAPPLLASFPTQKAVVVTVNRVQDVCPNGVFAPEGIFTSEKLLERWNEGEELDIGAYRRRRYSVVHIGDLFLRPRQNP